MYMPLSDETRDRRLAADLFAALASLPVLETPIDIKSRIGYVRATAYGMDDPQDPECRGIDQRIMIQAESYARQVTDWAAQRERDNADDPARALVGFRFLLDNPKVARRCAEAALDIPACAHLRSAYEVHAVAARTSNLAQAALFARARDSVYTPT